MRLYFLWSQLFYILLFFSKDLYAEVDIIDVDGIDEGDKRRPIWNVAHMVNSLRQVNYYLNLGANSIEFDIAFDTEGVARFTFHGIPCDCFRSCMNYENVITYIDYLRQLTTPGDPLFRDELVLLFLDLKVQGLSPSSLVRAGEDVAMKLWDYYWNRGSSNARAYILVSLPSINQIGIIRGLREALKRENASEYDSKIGFDFSGNEDLTIIKNGLEDIGVQDRVWQGDGITNCLPRGTGRLLEALNRRDNRQDTYIDKVYWWTVDRKSTMRRTLNLGVDALITNYPQSLMSVLREDEFSGQVRLADYRDNPWKKLSRRSASLINAFPMARSRNSTLEKYEEEEILYNS